MDKEISSAVSYALNKGFQIHPDALEILHKIDVNELAQIIKDVVREKTKQKVFLINECIFIISHRKESIKSASGDIIFLEKHNGITKRVEFID